MTDKNEEGFISRWSRKKSAGERVVDEDKTNAIEENDLVEESSEYEQSLPLWQQKEVEPEAKKKALSALFKQPEFSEVDHMNEYDEDFTRFTGLGDIVTQEMKRMLRLVEEKTRPKDDNIQPDRDTKNAQNSNNENVEIDNNEEDKLA